MSESTIEQERGHVELKRGWTFLLIGGMFEPLWIVSMKLSEGFTLKMWAFATLVLSLASMYFLALALRSKIPVGTAYSVWVGIGAIGALIAGILLFNESSDAIRLGFVLLIVIGIMGVQIMSKRNTGEKAET